VLRSYRCDSNIKCPLVLHVSSYLRALLPPNSVFSVAWVSPMPILSMCSRCGIELLPTHFRLCYESPTVSLNATSYILCMPCAVHLGLAPPHFRYKRRSQAPKTASDSFLEGMSWLDTNLEGSAFKSPSQSQIYHRLRCSLGTTM
jgi:hypothetical protein